MSLEKKVNVPVVCTRGVVVYPNQDLTIEVGRSKSINAVNEAEDKYSSTCWVVAQKQSMIENPQVEDLFSVGTLCKIKSVRKKDGFYRVTFSGISRASLVEYNNHQDMMFATVEKLEDVFGDKIEEEALVRTITKEIKGASLSQKNLPVEIVAQLTRGVSPSELADQFAQYFSGAVEFKQQILETLNVNERLLKAISLVEQEKQIAVIESEINEKVKERMEDSQKDYYLREKLRAIKEELGDVSSTADDSDQLRKMIEENPYPQNIKDKALEELARYEMLPQAAGEAGVVRTYLDWLLKTPWWQESTDNEDLNVVSERLDEDHFGLEKIKERVLEYLAVKQLTNSLKSPILCLVGPPGVGKTSLAKSIARSLDRQFVKVSLGGVRDESEIRGHRRTYLGSLPGRFIQGMKKAGVINPVFLIDEIDKMGYDHKGDPSSALLEVLDPEQNKMFSDHYLEEAYDLSKVMFIATANYLDNIPEALRDRLEIINLSSYTELEKLEIAKKHLISKQLKNTGLNENQLELNDDVLTHIIRYYTREAGVRQLERTIASLCRKTALAVLKEKKVNVVANRELLNEWLGKEKFEYGKREITDQVGVVTGLAYTSFGGDVLPVEVTTFEGKGKLIVTGQLGDVMKESTSIALGYVKSNAKQYEINPEFFDKHDIHIHVPEGAVPKDGPSAGVTLTTALVSSLTNRPVKADLAMTGEVTLRGNVLAIGGLKEKSMAAHRCGITTIVIPKSNLKDMDDLPDTIKKEIKFVPVENVEEVLKEALVK